MNFNGNNSIYVDDQIPEENDSTTSDEVIKGGEINERYINSTGDRNIIEYYNLYIKNKS